MSRYFLGLLLFAAVLSLSAAEYRGVMLQKGNALEFVTTEGITYQLRPNSRKLPPILNRDVLLTTSARLNRPADLAQPKRIFWNGVRETPANIVMRPYAPAQGKKIVYAKTPQKLPDDQLKPGATISLELPELGNSASSGGSKPIAATFKLPADFDKDQTYPVIIHFGGGTGGPNEALRY